ncbi:MAG TPA: S41 family peptidase [Bacteroidales bacterium]|nr:S41 family peptidase [Bacteroidales bacterium]
MKINLKFLLLWLLILPSCVEEPVRYPNTWQGNFEALWNTIDQRYCYLDYKHVNWDSIHLVYKNRVSIVSDEMVFFDVMGQMLNELKDGHVNLFSDFDVSRYWSWFQNYLPNFQSELIYSPRYLGTNYRISGGMRYKKIDGGNIGYIYLGEFTSTFTKSNLIYIFDYFSTCQGLIIDVRNNGGGYLSQAETLASCFFKERTLTGYMSHKIGDGHSDFSKPLAMYTEKNDSMHWDKPVAILTNRSSYSATNAFVSSMNYAPRATIIGDRTGGGGGLPLSNELPNGWLVRFSAVPMYDASMQHIEWGLDPDIKVDMRSSDEVSGYDTIIETAVAFLKGL